MIWALGVSRQPAAEPRRLRPCVAVNLVAQQILNNLSAVSVERQARSLDPALASKVTGVKAFQHARFMRTYADLLRGGRYAGAARFFLDDLYGPRDFSARDDQFARVVPSMSRFFSREICDTVLSLSELHALSEQLDTAMAFALPRQDLDGAAYASAWRAVGRPELRTRQIELMLTVGRALDRYTRSSLLRHSLRLMRAPAHAAGLGALQEFLERGFDTFRTMRGGEEFLATIAQRERTLADRLFSGEAAPELGPG